MEKDFRKKLAKELFKRKKKPEYNNSITAKEPIPLSEANADITFFELYARKNKGFKYCFTCIDIYSRYAWCRPLKTKTAKESLEAFIDIFDGQGGKFPQNLTTDNGSEFMGIFQMFCSKEGILQRS